jgi:hypothetical protein
VSSHQRRRSSFKSSRPWRGGSSAGGRAWTAADSAASTALAVAWSPKSASPPEPPADMKRQASSVARSRVATLRAPPPPLPAAPPPAPPPGPRAGAGGDAPPTQADRGATGGVLLWPRAPGGGCGDTTATRVRPGEQATFKAWARTRLRRKLWTQNHLSTRSRRDRDRFSRIIFVFRFAPFFLAPPPPPPPPPSVFQPHLCCGE